jgi:hypothetical protein
LDDAHRGAAALGWTDDTTIHKVTLVYTVDGDADLNGTVNCADLDILLSNFNQTGATWAIGDFNYDGTVNGADLNILLSNFNQHFSSSVTAVPEPGAFALLVAAGLGLVAYIRRKRA